MEMKATSQDKDGYNISLNYKVDTIRVYKQAIEVLGNPRFVQFFINRKDKMLYMQGTDEKTKDALEVPPKDQMRSRCYLFHGVDIIRVLSQLGGWKIEKPHILRGNYIPQYNVISFDLTKALPM